MPKRDVEAELAACGGRVKCANCATTLDYHATAPDADGCRRCERCQRLIPEIVQRIKEAQRNAG